MNNGSYTQYCRPELEISDEKITLPMFWLMNSMKLNYMTS